MNVVWTETALSQLTSVFEHIGQDSPHYALRMVDRITNRSQQLSMFPESGHVVPEYQNTSIREVIEGAYRIIYRLHTEEIQVVSVIHGSHLLPNTPPSS